MYNITDAWQPDRGLWIRGRLLLLVCFGILSLWRPVPTLRSAPTLEIASLRPAPDGTVQVILELEDAPAVEKYATARARGEAYARGQGQEHVRTLDQKQRRLSRQLARLGSKIIFRTQRAYNGIGLVLPLARVAALQDLPGVKAIHPAVRHQPALDRNLHAVGAPAAWSTVGGLTGVGQTIAIIDTGIDYTHADFGGAGTPESYMAAHADERVAEPGSGFPNAKIVGGVDLVGDSYDAEGSGSTTTPVRDQDPIDCYGHGTHVAGIAAGLGVTAAGKTYTGNYDQTAESVEFAISPGVAPRAMLYAIKIFGCSGSSAMTPAGVEWALDPNGDGDIGDRADVINLSLGSTFGSGYDASVVAVNNAAKAGAVVVASAGNDGDTYYVTSSPATADLAISVAASDEQTMAYYSSRGPRRSGNILKPDLAAPGSSIYSASQGSGNQGRYLSGTSMAAPHVAAAAALLREQHPGWTVEQVKATIINTANPDLFSNDGTRFSPLRMGAGRLGLAAAVQTQAIALSEDDAGRVHLSFGAPEVVSSLTLVKTLRVTNLARSGAPITYQLAATPVLSTTGVTVMPAVDKITVRPGSSTAVPIVVSIPDATKLGRSRDPSLVSSFRGPRHSLSEVTGYITLRPSDARAVRLHVGYYLSLRPAGEVWADLDRLALDAEQGAAVLPLRGTTPISQSLVSVYELQHRSPPRSASPVETGSVSTVGEAADIELVGVTSDFRSGNSLGATTVAFGLSSYASWSTPSEVTWEVDIDSDRDGDFDYRLQSYDYGPAGSGSGVGDLFVVQLITLSSGQVRTVGQLSYLDGDSRMEIYNARVTGMAVGAESIGLSADATRFNYCVRTYHVDLYDQTFSPVLVDETPLLSYDIARPSWSVQGNPVIPGTPLYHGTNMTSLRLSYTRAGGQANRPQGLLLLHHHNRPSHQTQIIPVVGDELDAAHRLFLPIVGASKND